MLSTVILPWIHYAAILTLAGAAIAKLYLLSLPASADQIRALVRADRLDGGSALVVLVTGLLRVWYGAKPAEYYWHNGLFHGVLGAFVLAALISLVPTLRILRWNKALAASGALPDAAALRKTRVFLHPQLTLVMIVALLITFVAKGYGAAP